MQNASSVLYRPTAGPRERAAALAHKRRAEALDGQVREPKVIREDIKAAPPPTVIEERSSTPTPGDSIAEWVKRQRELFPPLPVKPLWFSIAEEIGPSEPQRPTIDAVQRAVARYYDVSRSDIMSARRTANVVRPRQVAMYLARTLTLRSLPEIGRRFGGRDHTTVLHAVRKVERLIKTHKITEIAVRSLTEELQPRQEESEGADA